MNDRIGFNGADGTWANNSDRLTGLRLGAIAALAGTENVKGKDSPMPIGQKLLPPELTSLVHHIELNKAGWWDKAVHQFLIAVIWISNTPQSVTEILGGLHTYFKIDIDNVKARAELNRLCSKGVLVCVPSERFKLAEAYQKKYEEAIKETESLELEVERLFAEILHVHCPTLDPKETWESFNRRFLGPYVKDVGAATYRLLCEGNLNIHPARFERFLKAYPADIHKAFRRAVEAFLDPHHRQVRSYILRLLNTYFFLEASSLKKDTLDALIKFTGSKPTFYIFVDTNFLFSILGLIPSADEFGSSLPELIKELSGKVTIRLYALPSTVDEAKRKLIATKQNLIGLRTVPNLADAALRMNLDGIHLKFFEDSKKRALLSAEEYFDPYITDMTAVMRTKGVELFNEDIDSYKTNQAVINDIMAQLSVEQRRYKERAKNYEKLEHDMILWHFVRDKRPLHIESPLQAKYWAVTIDYRMLGFDKFKKRKSTRRPPENVIPICLYPTTLMQMLQFWVPRTAEFEEALFNSMRLPFFYQDFDSGAEKVTLDILKTLGRYENIGDLPTDTISSILLNTALRQKMSAEKAVDKKANLVREALIEEHHQTELRLKKVSAQLVAKEQQLASESQHKEAAQQELATKERDRQTLQKRLVQLEATSRAEKEALESRVTQLEQSALVAEQESKIQNLRRTFTLKWVIAPLLMMGGIVALLGVLLSRFQVFPLWWILLAIASVFMLLLASVVSWAGSRNPDVITWSPFVTFEKSKKWLFGLLWLLLIGLLVNFLYDILKTKMK